MLDDIGLRNAEGVSQLLSWYEEGKEGRSAVQQV